jgi:hypothetical protein
LIIAGDASQAPLKGHPCPLQDHAASGCFIPSSSRRLPFWGHGVPVCSAGHVLHHLKELGINLAHAEKGAGYGIAIGFHHL